MSTLPSRRIACSSPRRASVITLPSFMSMRSRVRQGSNRRTLHGRPPALYRNKPSVRAPDALRGATWPVEAMPHRQAERIAPTGGAAPAGVVLGGERRRPAHALDLEV